ncbi:AcrR family transcriptional regulator [Caulobacter ginsengisoli]|uniref:AcrR family transcriptional regulator n=1 Tax=Caulobacter ginsengisoli TaxID=400775 RepID=A0ABU0IPM3_9CAUL|nr:TetR/AcrR family transcriptional regulator [Caulobacter ginsengisoli]MDQ0463961.1 AcrR family transcriptional regulator [Caulobacter ginsengisoli]
MRKPRADSLRNRERLLEAAKAGFTEVGPEVSLEEIARRAGVGIGTLYRHFPTRDAVVEAVYRREVEQLAEAAGRLSETLAPAEALHAWMRLFIDYIATKKVVAPALGAMVGGPSELYAVTGQRFTTAISDLVSRGVAAGEIRSDVEPYDVLRAVGAFAYGASGPGWEASALRLVDIFMDGLRAQ